MDEAIIRHYGFPEYAFYKPTEELKKQLDIAFKDNKYSTKWPDFRNYTENLYILCHFDDAVGYLVLIPGEHRYHYRPEVYFGQMFAIAPKLRGQGYGRIFSELIDEYVLSLKGKVIYGNAADFDAAEFWYNHCGYVYAHDNTRPIDQPTVYKILSTHDINDPFNKVPSRLEIWARRDIVPQSKEESPDAIYPLNINLKKYPVIAYCPGDYHLRIVINGEYATRIVKCKYLNRYLTNSYECYPFLILDKLEFKKQN